MTALLETLIDLLGQEYKPDIFQKTFKNLDLPDTENPIEKGDFGNLKLSNFFFPSLGASFWSVGGKIYQISLWGDGAKGYEDYFQIKCFKPYTGNLPGSIIFGITDNQVSEKLGQPCMQKYIGPFLVPSTGVSDQEFESFLSEQRRRKKEVKECWYPCPGNHSVLVRCYFKSTPVMGLFSLNLKKREKLDEAAIFEFQNDFRSAANIYLSIKDEQPIELDLNLARCFRELNQIDEELYYIRNCLLNGPLPKRVERELLERVAEIRKGSS